MAAAWREAGVSIGQICANCPNNPAGGAADPCGYRMQYDGDLQIWVFTHAALSLAPRSVFTRGDLPQFDIAVMDEAPFGGLYEEMQPLPITALERVALSTREGLARLQDKLPVIARLLRAAPAEITVETVAAAGITASVLRDLQDRIWWAKPDVEIDYAAPIDAIREAVKASGGGDVVAVNQMLGALIELLDGEGPRIVRTLDDFIRVKRRIPFAPNWAAMPLLLLDATSDPEIAGRWLPGLEIGPAVEARETHVLTIQAVNGDFGKRRLDPKTEGGRKRLAKLGRWIEMLAAAHRGQGRDGIDIAVVTNKDAIGWLRRWFDEHGCGDRIATGHFNNLRGYDGWGGVRTLVVIGAPTPPPLEIEERAAVVLGQEVARIGRYQPVRGVIGMRDGTGIAINVTGHADPGADRMLRQIRTAEVAQVTGRARGVRRGPDDPLDVVLLTDVPVPQPVDAVVAADDLLAVADDPLALMLARGLVPEQLDDVAKVIADRIGCSGGHDGDSDRGIPPSLGMEAVRKRLDRAGSTDAYRAILAMRKEAGEMRTSPYKAIPYKEMSASHRGGTPARSVQAVLDDWIGRAGQDAGRCLRRGLLGSPERFRRFAFRPDGSRQSRHLLIDPERHFDPRVVVEAVVGPVASFVELEPRHPMLVVEPAMPILDQPPTAGVETATVDPSAWFDPAPSPFAQLLAGQFLPVEPAAANVIAVRGADGKTARRIHDYGGPHGADLFLHRAPDAVWPPRRPDPSCCGRRASSLPPQTEPEPADRELRQAFGLSNAEFRQKLE